MAESVVERLRLQAEPPKSMRRIQGENFYFKPQDARALLAAVEAAKDVCDDPKSGVPDIMATFRLVDLRKRLDAIYATPEEPNDD